MKKIEIFEEALNGNGEVNYTMLRAYKVSNYITGNDVIDFHEVIWNNEVNEIVKLCRENEIKEFTISSTFSSLIETLMLFEELGVKTNGLTRVKAPYKDFMSNDYAIIPAIKMVVGD